MGPLTSGALGFGWEDWDYFVREVGGGQRIFERMAYISLSIIIWRSEIPTTLVGFSYQLTFKLFELYDPEFVSFTYSEIRGGIGLNK